MDKGILKQAAALHPDKIMQPYGAMMGLNGFDAVCAFAEHLGGLTVYVPSIRTILAQCLEEEVRKDMRSESIRNLSRKYGFTERHLRRIVASIK